MKSAGDRVGVRRAGRMEARPLELEFSEEERPLGRDQVVRDCGGSYYPESSGLGTVGSH